MFVGIEKGSIASELGLQMATGAKEQYVLTLHNCTHK